MRLLSRTILRELVTTALLWAVLFTFLIFLMRARPLFEFLVRSTGPHSTVHLLVPAGAAAIAALHGSDGRAGGGADHAHAHVDRRRNHGDARGRHTGTARGAADFVIRHARPC